jgi:hypothetical protein
MLFPAVDGHMTAGNQMSHSDEHAAWQVSIVPVFPGLQHPSILYQNFYYSGIDQGLHISASLGRCVSGPILAWEHQSRTKSGINGHMQLPRLCNILMDYPTAMSHAVCLSLMASSPNFLFVAVLTQWWVTSCN